jgi:hypothetical protein
MLLRVRKQASRKEDGFVDKWFRFFLVLLLCGNVFRLQKSPHKNVITIYKHWARELCVGA